MKKVCLMLLALAMVLTLIPARTAFVDGTSDDPLPGKYFITWVVADVTLTQELAGPYTGAEVYPYSVPQSYDCHYQMDWWSEPVVTYELRFEDGNE